MLFMGGGFRSLYDRHLVTWQISGGQRGSEHGVTWRGLASTVSWPVTYLWIEAVGGAGALSGLWRPLLRLCGWAAPAFACAPVGENGRRRVVPEVQSRVVPSATSWLVIAVAAGLRVAYAFVPYRFSPHICGALQTRWN